MKKNKRFFVIGCSRLGASIASWLSLSGHEVTIMDQDADSFRKLHEGYSGYIMTKDAQNSQNILDLDLQSDDVVIVVTDHDNLNLMVSEIASKILGVKKVYARLYDQSKEPLCQTYQIEFINTSSLAILEFEKRLGGVL
ncbi:MAG: TrkA family potassium uptake protein [Erysipelotrichia bacterium]|jgi:trk system potassium uptake protein TrkA|nr:TrkA family potassium uptake protein [Erysipelotrichia bacterium]